VNNRPLALSPTGLALHCDEYELTMAQSFLRHGQTGRACFELVVRSLPPHRGYLVVAGVEQALAYFLGLRFAAEDLDYLEATGAYDSTFIEHLARLRFSGDVDAIAEGTPIGAETPLLRVVAPRLEATIVESALLAIVNHQTLIASKAARVVDAATGRPVWDFSLRRVHSPDAAVPVARAAYLAGAAGTATVVAGRLLGIPTTGTMAHHYVLAFGPEHEQAAFEQFLRDYPRRAVLLVDTYDTLRGVERAIAASRAVGVALAAIRLDSGDMEDLSRRVRQLLEAAGFSATQIVASGDLDEYRIAELLAAAAPIDSFGVGTMLGTSADAPYLGGIYKLVAQERDGIMEPVMKLASAKLTDPGMHQVFRGPDGDVIALAGEALPGRPLLEPVLRGGRLCADIPSLHDIRSRCLAERETLLAEVRRIHDPQPFPVRRSPNLEQLRAGFSAGAAEVPTGGLVA
jgi:nicotinate phosphoribosyltransferase